jgi:peptide/nickel transport system ATP-binding protein
MCDRLAIMYMGQIVEKGPTEEIVTNPKHPYTKSLIDAVPVPDPMTQRKRVELKGEVGDAINVPTGCRFKDRCDEYIGEVCDKVSPPLEPKLDIADTREVACHLYEGAGDFDPYAELDESNKNKTEQVPSDDD